MALRSWRGLVFALLVPLAATAEEPSARHLQLELHARAAHAMLRDERAAWVSLNVPLERMAAPRRRSLREASPVAVEARAPGAPFSTAANRQVAAAPPAPAAAREEHASSESGFGVAELRALVEFEQLALARALSVSGLGADLERLNGLAARARVSALLPELRLRAQRNTDQALRWAPTNDDPYRISQADGAGIVLEASASFRLDRLLFASEELAIERLRAGPLSLREKLVERIQTAFAGLLRLHFEACAAPLDSVARVRARAATFELLAELDFVTGGWFSGRAAKLSADLWGSPNAIWGDCQLTERDGTPAPASVPMPAIAMSVAKADDSE